MRIGAGDAGDGTQNKTFEPERQIDVSELKNLSHTDSK